MIRPPYIECALEHLGYSRYERLHFRLLRRWPQSVARRRLWARALDEQLGKKLFG